ncbi:uncharacterized protein LOC132714771 [Ruditapes philippinarum]|uniref:uncharacterized protein LOC132714771 n=1 Tax=Ruditapes philippinarum TaxID=129788 RepID=UPI00295B08FF|nr:uncharacterized protein LOC132714771 [Ruditapes philippinarum]
MILAYQAVKEKGWNVEKAARSFGVPAQTLRDRTRGAIDPYSCRTGPKTTLTYEEEETLVVHAEVMAELGYGFSNRQFQVMAGELMNHLGRRTETKPLSNNWLYAFLSRWKHRLASLTPRKLESTRAKSTTPEAVDNYFKNLEEIMTKYDLQSKPQLIYNVDETGIQPDHRPPNVIATPGSKPQAVTSPRSTTTTLIACANALGNAIPPYFIFKGKRYYEDLLEGASPGSRGVVSDSGWSNSTIFKRYLEEHFLPLIGGGGTKDDPILLILDGHASHVPPSLIEWAKERHLILFVLPAHTSHVLQPLDVAVFGPFKTFYYQECASFMQRNMGQIISRYDMAQLSCRANLKAMSPVNVQSAFRKTGILPLNRDIVSQDKLFPCETFREEKPIEKVCAIKSGKEAVQEFLRLKAENIKSPEPDASKCHCHKRKLFVKPKPGGRAITEDTYLDDMNKYETDKQAEKENMVPKKGTSTALSKVLPQSSPRPSTSGVNVRRDPVVVDFDSEDEIIDDVPCCVCGKTTPPTLRNNPDIKIVSWAQCDNCSHWVHLRFCTEIRVVRRHSNFKCIHCQI